MQRREKEEKNKTLNGFLAAFGTYFLWGIFPIYMKALSAVNVAEIIAHRIIWSVPTAAIILLFLRGWGDFVRALKNPHMVLMAALTALLITSNWTVYVWAIVNNHAVDAALGYYINPLFNVLLGSVLLHERLNRPQWVAVGFAFIAVAILTINAGGLPWVALLLPLTFGFYGFFRKSLPIGPSQGFMLEALILFVPGLIVAVYFIMTGQDHFIHGSSWDTALLIGCGPMTAIPLILFAIAAKRLNLSTLGLMQYITPTFLFLIAVFLFKEPFSLVQLSAFALIWLGLIIYTLGSIKWTRFSFQAERKK